MQVNFGAWHFWEISAYNKPASKIFIVQAKGYKKVLPPGKKVRDLAGLRPKYTRLCRNRIVKYLPPIGGDGRGPKGRGQAIVVITEYIPRYISHLQWLGCFVFRKILVMLTLSGTSTLSLDDNTLMLLGCRVSFTSSYCRRYRQSTRYISHLQLLNGSLLRVIPRCADT